MSDTLKTGRAGRFVRFARMSAVVGASIVSLPALARATPPGTANAAGRLVGLRLWTNPDSPARRQADAWARSRPAEAELLARIANQPTAQWMGNWNRDIRGDVARIMARAAGSLPVFVAYNIPNRDCGSYSAGGSASGSAYGRWIREFARGLGGRPAVVVLEPDAVPQSDCLKGAAREERFALLRDAIQVLKSAGGIVYLDAGNARWLKPAAVADRLIKAGLDMADGFSLNVSNYLSTSSNVSYGEAVSRLTGGKHFIIDTSRNGLGGTSNGQWCNPSGQGLGAAPTTRTGHPLVDALLWVKQPGESDGTCNGGPRAGAWWVDNALELARRQPSTVALLN